MLQALEDIGRGKLYTIDINPKVVSLAPEELRLGWRFVKGSLRQRPRNLLLSIESVDIFFHDSEHSYENMMFEFKTVWPFLTNGGALLSHDTDLNAAFEEFSQEVSAQPIYLGRKFRMGAIKKTKSLKKNKISAHVV